MVVVCVLAALGLSCAAEHRGSSDAAAAVGGAGEPVEQSDVPDDYACGGAPTCDGRYQFCEHIAGGPAPGLNVFQCTPIPAACDNDHSCACLAPNLFASHCEGDAGHVTLWVDWD